MRIGKVRLDRLRRKQAERKVTGTNRTFRREFWHVHQIRRTYDRSQGKFSFNISYSTAVKLTPRTKVVAEAFGLGIDEELMFPVLDVELKSARLRKQEQPFPFQIKQKNQRRKLALPYACLPKLSTTITASLMST